MFKPRQAWTRVRRKTVRLFDTRRDRVAGLPPGTPVHVGPPRDFLPWASFFQYSPEHLNEVPAIEPDEIGPLLRNDRVNWMNVEGVHDMKLIQDVGAIFGLHGLTLEDIANTGLRPQFESYLDYYFFAIKMLYINDRGELANEHVSLILKGSSVLTFQETPGDVFGRIRDRLRAQTGKARTRGADYLIYALIDSIVDGYYQVVDRLGEKIDSVEDELRCGPRDVHLARIFELRREILFLRKNIMPVRDLLNKVQVEGRVFQDHTKIYLKDLSDHVIQVTESLNLAMEMSGVLIDTYHSMQNQRLNAVMKTLTMLSTVFLPLNFIASIYGMNFEHMPELKWRYGYAMTLSLMLLVLAFMLVFFVRKGWLFESRHRRGKNDLWALFENEEEAREQARAGLHSTSKP